MKRVHPRDSWSVPEAETTESHNSKMNKVSTEEGIIRMAIDSIEAKFLEDLAPSMSDK